MGEDSEANSFLYSLQVIDAILQFRGGGYQVSAVDLSVPLSRFDKRRPFDVQNIGSKPPFETKIVDPAIFSQTRSMV